MKLQKTYKIRSGNNYCNRFNLPLPHRPLWKPTEMVAKLTLNESMIYRNENDGWMKLCGFSRGHHHDNSFRFVWRCWDGKIEIAAYCYINGIRKIKELALWPIDKALYNMEITLTIRMCSIGTLMEAIVGTNHNTALFNQGNANDFPFGYLLTPYFENPKAPQTGAPHDINIPLQITIR